MVAGKVLNSGTGTLWVENGVSRWEEGRDEGIQGQGRGAFICSTLPSEFPVSGR